MYLRRNIVLAALAFFVALQIVGGVQVFSDTRNAHGSIAETVQTNKYNLQPHYPQYTSEYPSEYTPYYPPQYSPFPTQDRPQKPPQQQYKPTYTIPTKPTIQQSTRPTVTSSAATVATVSVQKPHQILNQSLKPLNQYNHRYPDGSYEFRYELPDETVRYERGYFIKFHQKRSLVVRGFYSYKLGRAGYLTVFYTADHHGYRQDSAEITLQRPLLPRSLGERSILEDEEPIIDSVPSINDNRLQ